MVSPDSITHVSCLRVCPNPNPSPSSSSKSVYEREPKKNENVIFSGIGVSFCLLPLLLNRGDIDAPRKNRKIGRLVPWRNGIVCNQASMTTLSTRFPSSSEVRLASSKAPLALSSPLNRCVTMSSRLGSVNPAPVAPSFCAQRSWMPVR